MQNNEESLKIDVKCLVGKLKKLKEDAYKQKIKKEKEKYELKKKRERERYHEKKLKQKGDPCTSKFTDEETNPESNSFRCSKKLPDKDHSPEEATTLQKLNISTSEVKISDIDITAVPCTSQDSNRFDTLLKEGRTSRKGLSIEAKREREREKKRKQRAKVREDNEKYSEYLRKRKENYEARKKSGKVKGIADLKKRDQAKQRRKWRENSRKYRESLKNKENVTRFLNENTPPVSRSATPDAIERQQLNTQKRPRKLKSKNNGKLSRELKTEKCRAERYKKRLQRVLKSVENMNSPSPNTKAKNIMKRGNPAEIKKELVFGKILQKDSFVEDVTVAEKIVIENELIEKSQSSSSNEEYHINDFILVKLMGKKKLLHFVAQIQDLENEKLSVKFLKSNDEKFFWPTLEDISDIAIIDIETKLPPPEIDRRLSISFDFDFSKYVMG